MTKLICCFCENTYSQGTLFCDFCNEYKGLMTIKEFDEFYGERIYKK